MSAILVVDDDPHHADYLVELLRRDGRMVEQARSAKQALRFIARGDFGMVITDLLMPEADGIELLREIHRDYPDVRVIGVTGCDAALRQLAKQLMSHFGLHDLLPKPIDTAALKLALTESPRSDSHGGYR